MKANYLLVFKNLSFFMLTPLITPYLKNKFIRSYSVFVGSISPTKIGYKLSVSMVVGFYEKKKAKKVYIKIKDFNKI
jgi:hypothetical protein